MKKIVITLFVVIIVVNMMPGRDSVKDLEALLKIVKGEKRIDILLKLAMNYRNVSSQRVIDSGQEALELLKKYPNKQQEIQLLIIIGNAYIDNGQVDPGLSCINNGRKLAEAIGDKKGLADALHSIAAAYLKFGNYDLALNVSKEVLEIRSSLNISSAIAESHRTIGRIFSGKGDYETALKSYLTALNLQEECHDQIGMAYTYADIGSTYQLLKKFTDARHYFQLALELHKKTGNKTGLLICLNCLANVLRDSAKQTMEVVLKDSFYRETIKYYTLALQLQDELGYRSDMVSALLNIGEAYEYLNQFDKAFQSYSSGLRIAREQGEASYEAYSLAHIAVMYGKQNQHQKALDTASLTLKLTDSLQDKNTREKIYADIAGLFSGLGNYKNAFIYFKKSKALNEEILNTGSASRIAILDALLNNKEKERQIELLEEKEKRHKNLLRFYFIIAVLILIIAVINYILYRIKKREEAAIREAQEKYHQLEDERLKRSKFESISLLASGIAHDFNNILGVILGYVDLVKMSLKPGSSQNRYLEKAEQAVNKAKNLAEKFLTFAENSDPIKQLVSIPTLINAALEQTLDHPDLKSTIPELKKRLDIKINIPNDINPINCNPSQIQQVISNVLINSIESMFYPMSSTVAESGDTISHKKRIEIKGENLYLDHHQIATAPAGDYILLSITDEGEGIPEQNVNKLFDPYFSTRQRVSQKGLGLGLTIVYSIVAKHGGHIDFISKQGQGTTVYIYLPMNYNSNGLPLKN